MSKKTDHKAPFIVRVLGFVTEVKEHEVVTALLLTLNVFLLLTAYYIIKPVREGLILELKSGAEYKSYMGGAIAVALLVFVPLYARFASGVARNKLVIGVTLFFVSHLVLFYLGSSIAVVKENLGLWFYLWVGIFNMMLVAQFWAFANDIYTEEQGKRLFPLVGLGASVGAAVGSKIAELLAIPLGRYQLMIVSAALLSFCALLFHRVHEREIRQVPQAPTSDDLPSSNRTPPLTKEAGGAFALVFRHKYLRLLALFSLVFTLVNTNGEYMLSRLFKESATQAVEAGTLSPDAIGDYLAASFGGFFFYVNVIGVLLQMFVVSRLVKHGGLKLAFSVLPVVALLGGMAFALVPVLAVLRVGKVFENATDYSVNNTVRNMLWLPTTREMKYQAKQAVDTFFIRMGDVVSAILVAVGVGVLGLSVRYFAVFNLVVVVGWLFLAGAILRENKRMQAKARDSS